jgi:hypothetical protein
MRSYTVWKQDDNYNLTPGMQIDRADCGGSVNIIGTFTARTADSAVKKYKKLIKEHKNNEHHKLEG